MGLAVLPVSRAVADSTVQSAITAVTTTPAKPGLHDPVTVNVAFCVPEGTASGDTFSLTVPNQLEPLTAGFQVTDQTTNIVAEAAVDSGVVTFTMTTYASDHVGICGTAYFQSTLVLTKVKANVANQLAFASGGQVYDTTVTPIRTKVPSPEQPLLYGTWAIPALEDHISGTDSLMWYVQAPVSPHPDGLSEVVFTNTAGPGQTIDCAHVGVQTGTLDANGIYTYVNRYRNVKSVVCTHTHLRLVTGSVPVGQDLRLVVSTNVVKRSSATFSSKGSVSSNGGKVIAVAAPAVGRAAAGGKASGSVGTPGAPSTAASSSSSSSSRSSSGIDFAGKAAIWLTVIVVALLGLYGLARRRS